MNINQKIKDFCFNIYQQGGQALIVGGAVRDWCMGDNNPKDIDIEIYQMKLSSIVSIAEQHADKGVNTVGISFGVLKCRIDGIEIDISLPRLDSKVGKGHKGFIAELKSDLTVEQAAARRDFTINAMAYDPLTGELFDPYKGQEAIKKKVLEPTSEAFMEDPLRVLRGMQFAGRFGFDSSTVCDDYCQEMGDDYYELSVERVWGEWEKWATKSVKPSKGLDFLYWCEWIWLYSQLSDMQGCKQDPEWHPEGDTYIHTLHVVDAMANICKREGIEGEDKAVLMLAALCHDMGKPETTELIDGRWRAPKHDKVGVIIAKSFLQDIGAPKKIIERVCPLVGEHMAHISMPATDRTVRRLSIRLHPANINELALLVEADMSGRPPLEVGAHPRFEKMLEIAKLLEIENKKPKPLVMGRHLLTIGFVAGPKMGDAIAILFEKQLNGEFSSLEDGLKIAKTVY